jgi:hypothetical protein
VWNEPRRTHQRLALSEFYEGWSKNVINHKTAIFRQVNRGSPNVHHDALEFPDGQIVLLTLLKAGQQATVLQLPASAVGSKLPQPLTYVLLPPMSQ